MCARVAYLILGAFFVFTVSTVAAFVYLSWWQAILVSGAVFASIILIGKLLIKRFFRGIVDSAREVMDERSRILRNATADVHSVKVTQMPDEIRQQMRQAIADAEDADEDPPEFPEYDNMVWAEIELTIFPDPKAEAQDNEGWDIDSLKLVPLDAKKISFNMLDMDDNDEEGDKEYSFYEIRLVSNGEARDWDGTEITGMQRILFVTGVPRGTRLLKLQYFFEHFGRVEIPPALGLPPARSEK
ncbi:MAG: hypothetical protein ACRC8S_10830 [Fimbriiglobus sp.]